jgi:hypothetical protein
MFLSEIQEAFKDEIRNRNCRVGCRAGGGETLGGRGKGQLGFPWGDGGRSSGRYRVCLGFGDMVAQSAAPAFDGFARFGALVRRQSEIGHLPLFFLTPPPQTGVERLSIAN